MKNIPKSTSARSKAFALRFLSLKISAPQMNEIITELRLTSDTTEIMESGSFKDVKYAKSPTHMKMEMRGMAQLHLKGVV